MTINNLTEIDYTFDTIISTRLNPTLLDSWTAIVNDAITTDAAGMPNSAFGNGIRDYLALDNKKIPDYSQSDTDNFAKVINLMTGTVITGTDQTSNFQNNYATSDEGRTQRFYSFWNDIPNPSDLGQSFSKFTNPKSTEPNAKMFVYRNIFLTYILMLVFEKLASSPKNAVYGTPLDVFTEQNNPFFCKAAENLRIFMSAASGIGNFPIFTGSNTGSFITGFNYLNYFNKYINKGYLSKFCNSIFVKSCPNVAKPNDDQECIQNYRSKISQSTVALSWCGCFAPLPSWVAKKFTEKDPVTTRDFPNSCDNLCFGPFNETIIKLYEAPFIAAGGTPQENPNTVILCRATICVIDENAINAVNSTGDINFNQICPKSGNNTVTICYLDVSNPNILDNVSSNGGNGVLSQVTFKQDCPDGICYTINSKGEQEITKCNEINTPSTGGLFKKGVDGLSGVKKYEKIYSSFWDGVLMIIFLLILFEFAYVEIHRYIQRSKLL